MNIANSSIAPNWYNSDAFCINGIPFRPDLLEPYPLPVPFIDPAEIKPSGYLTRFQLNKWHTAKNTELNLLINTLHLCEYYGLTDRDIENLVEVQSGYEGGWIEHLFKVIPSLTNTMQLEAMATISHTLDKLTGIETQGNFNLLCRSKLFYNYGMIYSFCNMYYPVPANRKVILNRINSEIQAAQVELNACRKYRSISAGKKPSKIIYKKWYLQ